MGRGRNRTRNDEIKPEQQIEIELESVAFVLYSEIFCEALDDSKGLVTLPR